MGASIAAIIHVLVENKLTTEEAFNKIDQWYATKLEELAKAAITLEAGQEELLSKDEKIQELLNTLKKGSVDEVK